MSIDIQKWKAEAHENAAKTVANMLQVSSKVLQSCGNLHTLYISCYRYCKFTHMTSKKKVLGCHQPKSR